MQADKAVIHQWQISPFCSKVRKILAFKGIPYKKKNYNGLLALKAARLTLAGKLPVLELDGKTLSNSSHIGEYLEQRNPSPTLYPKEANLRFQALLWEDWADESLFWYEVYFRFRYPHAWEQTVGLLCEGRPFYEKWIMKFEARRIYNKKLDAQGLGRYDKKTVEAKFFRLISGIDSLVNQNEWLVGKRISIADIAVAAQIEEVKRTADFTEKLQQYLALNAWLERVSGALQFAPD